MRNLFLIFLSVLLLSCGTKSVQETAEKPVEQVPTSIVAATVEPEIPALPMPTGSKEKEGESALKEEEDEFLEYATYYVTIADTGQSYFPLRAEMVRLSKEMNLPVDTMGRYYDRKKDLIVLPEDDEDEVYAGDYFPRRNPDAFLSLEYLDLYQDKAKEKTMALVSGIYEKKTSADSALAVLKNAADKAFVVKTKMYIGCMH